MRRLMMTLSCACFSIAAAGIALAADAPTVLLDNEKVRVLHLDSSAALADHPAAVVVPLSDGVLGKTGEAFWSGDAPRTPDDKASFIVVEPKPKASHSAPPAGPASAPGNAPFVGLSFKPLFENDRVSVIRGRMEVEAREGLHTHASDIVLVHLSGGVIEDTAAGRTRVNHWKPGDVELEELGSSHSARNLGPAVDAVLVTLKP